MGLELQCLLGSLALLAALLAVQGALVPAANGFKYGLGPRDEDRAPTLLQGRLNRTVANHMEGLALFAPLALMAKILAISTPMTQLGAILYLAGRIAFAACYLLGIPVLRSAVWGIATAGILMVAIGVVAASI